MAHRAGCGCANVHDAPPPRSIANDRSETEPCQRGTDGCAIDHTHDDGRCETW